MPHRFGGGGAGSIGRGQWVAVRSGRRAWRQARTWGGPGPSAGTEGAGQVWMGGGSVCPLPRRGLVWDRRAESGSRGSVSGAGTFLKGAFFAPRQSLLPTRVLGPGEACLVGRRETGSREKAAGRRPLPFAMGRARGRRLRSRETQRLRLRDPGASWLPMTAVQGQAKSLHKAAPAPCSVRHREASPPSGPSGPVPELELMERPGVSERGFFSLPWGGEGKEGERERL